MRSIGGRDAASPERAALERRGERRGGRQRGARAAGGDRGERGVGRGVSGVAHRPAGVHAVEEAAKRPRVEGLVGRLVAQHLGRREERRRALARRRRPPVAPAARALAAALNVGARRERAARPKVGELRREAGVQQHVVGLDVVVDEPLRVEVRQRARDALRDRQPLRRPAEVDGSVGEHRLERAATAELHHHAHLRLAALERPARAEEEHHVRVAQREHHRRLLLEGAQLARLPRAVAAHALHRDRRAAPRGARDLAEGAAPEQLVHRELRRLDPRRAQRALVLRRDLALQLRFLDDGAATGDGEQAGGEEEEEASDYKHDQHVVVHDGRKFALSAAILQIEALLPSANRRTTKSRSSPRRGSAAELLCAKPPAPGQRGAVSCRAAQFLPTAAAAH